MSSDRETSHALNQPDEILLSVKTSIRMTQWFVLWERWLSGVEVKSQKSKVNYQFSIINCKQYIYLLKISYTQVHHYMAKADIDFEKELWDAANELRGAVSENNYKNYILPLVFLKHLSERYDIVYGQLELI